MYNYIVNLKGKIGSECVPLPFLLKPVIKKMHHFIYWQVVHFCTKLFNSFNINTLWFIYIYIYTYTFIIFMFNIYKTQKSVLKSIVEYFASFLWNHCLLDIWRIPAKFHWNKFSSLFYLMRNITYLSLNHSR